MMALRNFSLVLAALIVSKISVAQAPCSERIQEAEFKYGQGQFQSAIELASGCKSSREVSESWKSYRILAMSYLASNSPALAKDAATQMLLLNPTYEPDVLNDPKDLRNLLRQVDIIPALSLGLSFMYGANICIPRITDRYNVTAINKDYSRGAGYQLGVVAGYNIDHRLGFEAQLAFKSLEYDLDYRSFKKEVEISETLQYFEIPVLFRYTLFPTSRLRVMLKVGGYGGLLVNSFNDLHLRSPEADLNEEHYFSQSRRENISYGLAGGIGLMYKRQIAHWSLDAHYFRSMSNIMDVDSRYGNQDLIYQYHYLDDDLRLDQFTVSIGYHRYFNYKLNN